MPAIWAGMPESMIPKRGYRFSEEIVLKR
jgi:hypothetical protein